VLREVIVTELIQPLSAKLEHPTASPAALIAAFLAGVGILRTVLGVTPLLEVEGGRLESLMSAAIDGIIKAEAAVEPAP
jgi:hypothetical protein